MRVVYLGTYSMGEGYPRNRVLIEGLKRAGVTVVEIREDFWEDAAHKIAGATGGGRRLRLAVSYLKTWFKLASRYLAAGRHDVVVVGYTGQLDLFPAWLLARLRGSCTSAGAAPRTLRTPTRSPQEAPAPRPRQSPSQR